MLLDLIQYLLKRHLPGDNISPTIILTSLACCSKIHHPDDTLCHVCFHVAPIPTQRSVVCGLLDRTFGARELGRRFFPEGWFEWVGTWSLLTWGSQENHGCFWVPFKAITFGVFCQSWGEMKKVWYEWRIFRWFDESQDFRMWLLDSRYYKYTSLSTHEHSISKNF